MDPDFIIFADHKEASSAISVKYSLSHSLSLSADQIILFHGLRDTPSDNTFKLFPRGLGGGGLVDWKNVVSYLDRERERGEKRKEGRKGKSTGMEKRGQLTRSEYTIPFPKWLDANCTLVAYLRCFGVDMSVTR